MLEDFGTQVIMPQSSLVDGGGAHYAGQLLASVPQASRVTTLDIDPTSKVLSVAIDNTAPAYLDMSAISTISNTAPGVAVSPSKVTMAKLDYADKIITIAVDGTESKQIDLRPLFPVGVPGGSALPSQLTLATFDNTSSILSLCVDNTTVYHVDLSALKSSGGTLTKMATPDYISFQLNGGSYAHINASDITNIFTPSPLSEIDEVLSRAGKAVKVLEIKNSIIAATTNALTIEAGLVTSTVNGVIAKAKLPSQAVHVHRVTTADAPTITVFNGLTYSKTDGWVPGMLGVKHPSAAAGGAEGYNWAVNASGNWTLTADVAGLGATETWVFDISFIRYNPASVKTFGYPA